MHLMPMPTVLAAAGIAVCGALALAGQAAPAGAEAAHAIAMHGRPAMPDGFTAPDYANADAPQGGRMVQGVLGTFDSLNPFIVKGLPPRRSAATSSKA